MDELMQCVVEIAPTIEELAAEFAALETELRRNTKETRLRQGEILVQLKLALPPGGFYKFLAEFGWSDRTARSYMQQAKEVYLDSAPFDKLRDGQPSSGDGGVAEQGRSPYLDSARQPSSTTRVSLRDRLREVVAHPGVRRGVENAIVPLEVWDRILEVLKVKEGDGAKD